MGFRELYTEWFKAETILGKVLLVIMFPFVFLAYIAVRMRG